MLGDLQKEDDVVEVEGSRLVPFKINDIDVNDYCDTCKHEQECAVIQYVNKLNRKRCIEQKMPIKTVNNQWFCPSHEGK